MDVNDIACNPDKRGALKSIASKPAPTGIALHLSAPAPDQFTGRAPDASRGFSDVFNTGCSSLARP
jgi:hypothetical protein